jgi:hypothetical protein
MAPRRERIPREVNGLRVASEMGRNRPSAGHVGTRSAELFHVRAQAIENMGLYGVANQGRRLENFDAFLYKGAVIPTTIVIPICLT